MEREGVDEKTALNMMKKMDKMRKVYHNFYCESKWGDSRTLRYLYKNRQGRC